MAKQHIEEKQQDINELMQVRRDKMQAFIDKGIEPFGRSYDVTHHAQELLDQFETLGEETVVRVAGRLMAVRGHGKASFTVVSDLSGKIQAYFRLDNLGEEKYGEFKLLDIGDIIGVEGTLFKTHRGEITIKVSDFSILAKSLRPLPEKFHGLKDVETRYRQRYLDLIVNPDVRQTFITRTKIIKSIRNYLDSRNFLEVETPVLSPIAGGANARPFITHHNALDIDMYLRIATELYLKRLVVGGFERVYEIGRIFRNEGIDVRHNPEFTSIEVYQAYADFNELMDLAEGIIKQAAMDACGTSSCRKRAGCAHRSRQGRTPFWLSGATCRVHLLPGASAECERVGFHLPCRGWQSRQSSLWKQTAPDKTLLSWTNTAPSAPPPGTPARCAGQAGSSTGSPQLLRRSRGSPGLHIRAAHRMAA